MRRAGMVVAVVILGLANAAWAETVVPAGSYAATTWTEAGSPYQVTGDVSFTELQVEAGTQVVVRYAASIIGISATQLTVNGTRDKPVVFAAESSDADPGWYGLSVEMGSLRYAKVGGARTGLEVWKGSVTVTESIFEGNRGTGIELFDAETRVEVDRTQFLANNIGIHGIHAGELFVDNSLFVGNGLNGITCGGIMCRVRNSTFDDNENGIYTHGGGLEVESSIFSNNTYGIQSSGAVRRVAYSGFWQNTVDVGYMRRDGLFEIQGEGNLFEYPQYVGPGDYRLSPSSPCIDAAGPNGPDHDFDGTPRPLAGDAVPDDGGLRSDMGAYEYNPNPDSTGGSGGEGGVGGSGAAGEGNEGETGGADAGVFDEGFGGGSGLPEVGGAAMGGALTGDAGSASDGDVVLSDPSLVSQSQSRGCGCRQVGAPRSGGAWLFGLTWMGLLAAAGRRRARA